MIVSADLTLKSGYKFQVEIHSIQSDSMGNVHSGKIKNSSPLSDQIEKDARFIGSWRETQEMDIEFIYRGLRFD